jgi:hypothetical protein
MIRQTIDKIRVCYNRPMHPWRIAIFLLLTISPTLAKPAELQATVCWTYVLTPAPETGRINFICLIPRDQSETRQMRESQSSRWHEGVTTTHEGVAQIYKAHASDNESIDVFASCILVNLRRFVSSAIT